MPAISMKVNVEAVCGDVEGRTLLVEFIREKLGLTGTHVVGRVIQHDFDDESIFALTGARFGEPIEFGPGPVLASGDVFVSGGEARERLAARADLVDMEGYAVARVAKNFGLEATLVKEVSDEAGADAGRSWQEALDACAERLGAWVRREVLAA